MHWITKLVCRTGTSLPEVEGSTRKPVMRYLNARHPAPCRVTSCKWHTTFFGQDGVQVRRLEKITRRVAVAGWCPLGVGDQPNFRQRGFYRSEHHATTSPLISDFVHFQLAPTLIRDPCWQLRIADHRMHKIKPPETDSQGADPSSSTPPHPRKLIISSLNASFPPFRESI